MHDELHMVLKDQRYCTCLLLKVPFAKIDRNEKTSIFFIFLLIIFNAATWLYIIPLCQPYRKEAGGTIAGFSVLLLISFLVATLRDPGYLKRDKNINFQQLLDSTDPYNICPDCKIIRTPRSRH